MCTRVLVVLKFDTGRNNSIERAKIPLTAVTGTSVLAGIISKLCQFEGLYKHTPKNKADCKNMEPLGGSYRELDGIPVHGVVLS